MKYIQLTDESLMSISSVSRRTRVTCSRAKLVYILTITSASGETLEWGFFTASERDRCLEEIVSFLVSDEVIIKERDIYEASLIGGAN